MDEDVAWRQAVSAKDEDQLGAAKLQHQIAIQVREALQRRKTNVHAFARRQGVDYTRLRRLLAGDVIMRLEDVARFERTLGIQEGSIPQGSMSGPSSSLRCE